MHRSINSFINLFIHPFISDGFPQVPVQLLLPHGLQRRRGNQVVSVDVYQCSISNLMSLGSGDIEALLYSKVHAVLECKKHTRCFIDLYN